MPLSANLFRLESSILTRSELQTETTQLQKNEAKKKPAWNRSSGETIQRGKAWRGKDLAGKKLAGKKPQGKDLGEKTGGKRPSPEPKAPYSLEVLSEILFSFISMYSQFSLSCYRINLKTQFNQVSPKYIYKGSTWKSLVNSHADGLKNSKYHLDQYHNKCIIQQLFCIIQQLFVRKIFHFLVSAVTSPLVMIIIVIRPNMVIRDTSVVENLL